MTSLFHTERFWRGVAEVHVGRTFVALYHFERTARHEDGTLDPWQLARS